MFVTLVKALSIIDERIIRIHCDQLRETLPSRRFAGSWELGRLICNTLLAAIDCSPRDLS